MILLRVNQDEVEGYWVNVNRFIPLKGGSYIELPGKIRNTGAVLNIKNKDEKCLTWCVIASKHPAKDHGDQISNYEKYINEINDKGITYPVTYKDYNKYEKQNNVKLNVYGVDEKFEIYPIRLNEEDPQNAINIL